MVVHKRRSVGKSKKRVKLRHSWASARTLRLGHVPQDLVERPLSLSSLGDRLRFPHQLQSLPHPPAARLLKRDEQGNHPDPDDREVGDQRERAEPPPGALLPPLLECIKRYGVRATHRCVHRTRLAPSVEE